MGKAQLECPNCQGAVNLGEITCPHCGVNMKSGESYEARVKRARGKTKHKEIYTGGLYIGIVLAVALCVFAGYMYQRSMEGVLSRQENLFKPLITTLQKVQDLAEAGKAADARAKGQALLKELQSDYDSIKLGPGFDVGQVTNSYTSGYTKKPGGDPRAVRRLLADLMAKTQHILDTLPAS